MIDFLSTNWTIVENNPLIFLVFFIVTSAMSFGLSRLHHSQQIQTLREKSDFYKTKLEDLQNELDVNSPEAAEEKIVSLQVEVDALRKQIQKILPPSISEDAKKKMIKTLSDFRGSTIEICRLMSSSTNVEINATLTSIFHEAGWRIANADVLAPSNPITTGIRIDVSSLENPTRKEQSVINAVILSGVPYKLLQLTHRAKRAESYDVGLTVF